MTTTLITMAGLAITSVILEKVLVAFGKIDLAQMVNIGGISLMSLSAIKLVVDLINTLKKSFPN